MAERKTNPPFLNGVPEMLLLQLLSRRQMYGYELVQANKAASGGEQEFGEGCIYPKQLAVTVDSWQRITAAIDHALQGGERGRTALAS
jgi:hypothetical protein